MSVTAQSVTAQLRDERGRPCLDDSGIPFPIMAVGGDLAEALPGYDDLSYPYLRLVDPYGDTIFSGYQMEVVIPELERLAAATHSEAVAKVLAMARVCASEVHTYLAFIGD